MKPAFPYLQTPASLAKPYLVKADQLGDSFLTKVDEKVPIVKSETAEIKSTIFDYATWPMVKATEGKEWIFKTYGEEYKKCGGDGIVAGGKALVTSSLVITSDVLTWLSSVVAAKEAEAKEFAQEKVEQFKKSQQ